MERLAHTYGKTWHTWHTVQDKALPVGVPQLMKGFTAEGQADPEMVEQRNRRLGVDAAKTTEQRLLSSERPRCLIRSAEVDSFRLGFRARVVCCAANPDAKQATPYLPSEPGHHDHAFPPVQIPKRHAIHAAVLGRQKVWLSTPASFNDPFDCAINLDRSKLAESVAHAVEKATKNAVVENSLKVPSEEDELAYERLRDGLGTLRTLACSTSARHPMKF